MPRVMVTEIRGHREHHVANLAPLVRPVAVNPNHPSLWRPRLFDWARHDPELARSGRDVLVREATAKAIVSLLEQARPHVPSPIACDDAIALLRGAR